MWLENGWELRIDFTCADGFVLDNMHQNTPFTPVILLCKGVPCQVYPLKNL
jgi:hypothetical protein